MTKVHRLWHHSGKAYIEYAPQAYGKVVVTSYEAVQAGGFDVRDSHEFTTAEAEANYRYWWRQGWLTNEPDKET